ncbi:MAG: RHS repeat-associated core domain-containing protein, partial [Bacteroidota bacterium]
RLLHIHDVAGDLPGIPDISGTIPYGSGPDNFRYDKNGNLHRDIAEGIDEILRTGSGKVRRINFTAASGKSDIEFFYNADEERIAKVVETGTDPADWQWTYYVRDLRGRIMGMYKRERDHAHSDEYLVAFERPLGAEKRIGIDTQKDTVAVLDQNGNLNKFSLQHGEYARKLGDKRYQLDNHLSNVLTVITDAKIPGPVQGTTADYFLPEVVASNDYYPFGMTMDGRSSVSDNYRYGFNGMEKDDEVKGAGNSYDFGARIYDPRLGRFLGVDPKMSDFPWKTPYDFANNQPINSIDLNGEAQYLVISTPEDQAIGEWYVANAPDGIKMDHHVLDPTSPISDQILGILKDARTKDAEGISFLAVLAHGKGSGIFMTGDTSNNWNSSDLPELQKLDEEFAPNEGDVGLFNNEALVFIGACGCGSVMRNEDIETSGWNNFAQGFADISGAPTLAAPGSITPEPDEAENWGYLSDYSGFGLGTGPFRWHWAGNDFPGWNLRIHSPYNIMQVLETQTRSTYEGSLRMDRLQLSRGKKLRFKLKLNPTPEKTADDDETED